MSEEEMDKAISADTAKHWIPVSRRLPDQYTNVLARTGPARDEVEIMEYRDLADSEGFHWFFPDGGRYIRRDIPTHWQPLPGSPVE